MEVYNIKNICEGKKQKGFNKEGDKVYSFDEGMDLAGQGRYGYGLLAVLSLATMAMGMDLFGFSVVVAGASCDLRLDLEQTNVLLSMPFIGPIIMSYPWGYISDVYGRKKSLLISMWGSFIISTISVFCSNWILLAVLKFLSASFSSCAQSATYTLLGESCPARLRDCYMLVMTSVLDLMLAVYIAISYGILNFSFSIDLIIITLAPWRLLALTLALFLGLAALMLQFFHESPKFLLNSGREDQALYVLREIWRRNRRDGDYPVMKIYLNEEGNCSYKDVSFLRSLWAQVAPLFQPPLLWRTLQLFFLIAIAYGTSNPYFVWFPLLAQKFFEGLYSGDEQEAGLCSLIVTSYNNDIKTGKCSSGVKLNVVVSSVAQGLIFVAIIFGLAKIAHRKRLMMILVPLVSCLCGLGSVLVPNSIISFILFFGQLGNELIIGVIYSYFVDLYPTSHRGMASCLGTMVARSSSLGGIYLFGEFFMTHCSYTFYVCCLLTICAVLISLLLPSDRLKKVNTTNDQPG